MILIQQSHRKFKKEIFNSQFLFSSRLNSLSQSTTINRLPVVRFIDDALRMNNSQHLTCIQNFLLQNNNHSRRYTNLYIYIKI